MQPMLPKLTWCYFRIFQPYPSRKQGCKIVFKHTIECESSSAWRCNNQTRMPEGPSGIVRTGHTKILLPRSDSLDFSFQGVHRVVSYFLSPIPCQPCSTRPLAADIHRVADRCSLCAAQWGLAGVPDFVMHYLGTVVMMEVKNLWLVTPQGIDEVLNSTIIMRPRI